MLSVDEAITSRRSVRAFKFDRVPHDTVAHILEVAARAPSGTNMQPWHVHVLRGDALTSLSDAVLDAFWNEPEKHEASRLHYLEKNRDPYLARRRKVGWDMYGLASHLVGVRMVQLLAQLGPVWSSSSPAQLGYVWSSLSTCWSLYGLTGRTVGACMVFPPCWDLYGPPSRPVGYCVV